MAGVPLTVAVTVTELSSRVRRLPGPLLALAIILAATRPGQA